MIEDLKVLANRRDVPYQSLLKVFLASGWQKSAGCNYAEPDQVQRGTFGLSQ